MKIKTLAIVVLSALSLSSTAALAAAVIIPFLMDVRSRRLRY